jgi:RNA polymerase sigma factor (sigma-70 family)
MIGMSAPLKDILEKRAQFLAFLKSRLKREDLAEEILQAAYLMSLEKSSGLKDDESVVAWFYRILRNAIVDHSRKAGVHARALASTARAQPLVDVPQLEKTVCRCVSALVPALKPEFGDLLSKVDLEGVPVQEAAVQFGLTANNASVRLHRARKALRDQVIQVCGACASHGCVDCSCGTA